MEKNNVQKDRVGNHEAYLKYKEFRKKLKEIIIDAKKHYHSKKFLAAKGDSQKTWKLINDLRGKSKSTIKPSFIIDSELVKNRHNIANAFHIYYTSIAENMNSQTNESDEVVNDNIPNFGKYMDKNTKSSIYLSDCTSFEIETIISELENGKSSDISVYVLKKCSRILSPFLSEYYNYFISQGIFPSILKIGRVTPVYKKGNPQLLGNYRPISTLPIMGKIFEKIIYSRLYNYFASKNILYDKQFGFRKNHSTSHAVNYSVNKIL